MITYSAQNHAGPQMTATFMQDGGSHVSYEDKLTTKVIPLMLIAFTLAATVIGRLLMKRRGEGGRVHPTLKTMMAALGMHWVFLAVHTMHLRAFAGTYKMWRMAIAEPRHGCHQHCMGGLGAIAIVCVCVVCACGHSMYYLDVASTFAAVPDLGSQAIIDTIAPINGPVHALNFYHALS